MSKVQIGKRQHSSRHHYHGEAEKGILVLAPHRLVVGDHRMGVFHAAEADLRAVLQENEGGFQNAHRSGLPELRISLEGIIDSLFYDAAALFQVNYLFYLLRLPATEAAFLS